MIATLTMGPPPVDVIYIAAKGRSGTTILGRSLAAVDGVTFIGETRLGPEDRAATRMCGCGVPVVECPTWRAVALSTGAEDADPGRAPGMLAFGSTFRARHLPAVALPGLGRRPAARVDRHVADAERVYRAIQEATGARVIVDSSKPPHYGWALCRVPGIRCHVIHLVRDPRAVAFSWARRRARSAAEGGRVVTLGIVQSALTWMASNLLAEESWRRASGTRHRLRYEDFVAEPRAWIAHLLAGLTAPAPAPPFEDEQVVVLKPDHTVAANPGRFATGPVRVVADSEWQTAMRPGHRGLVTALSAPLLRRYGYAGAGGHWGDAVPARSTAARRA